MEGIEEMSDGTETVKLRDYQLELYHEIEKRKSCILFLPTGSGKTYIAFGLIKSMSADLKKPIGEGGKRTFFLANTVQLVEQQTAVLSRLGNFEVTALTGDTGVDNYDKNRWLALECDTEVFVMTPQIYLDALSKAFLAVENANLIIFDECHHATGFHPMAQTMKRVRECDSARRPKILGLSATLLNANVNKQKLTDFNKRLRDLETTFDGEIITSKSCRRIRERYSTKPIEKMEPMRLYEVPLSTKRTLENLRDTGLKVLKIVKLKDNPVLDSEEQKMVQLHKPGLNRSKLLRNALQDILVHVDLYGLYVGYTCCQCYIIEMYRYLFLSTEPKYINIILYTVNLAQMMRKVLHTSIVERSGGEFEAVQTIVRTSSEKLQYLFNRLHSLKSNDRCIIFVQRKLTAKSLFKILKSFIQENPNCNVTVDFLTGGTGNPLRNTREGFVHKRQQKHVLNKFRRGEINVLIATDVLEEGIDVQECNLIIMFDPVKSFRSYVQSKGRARMQGSEYVILCDGPTANVESQVMDFKNIDKQLDHVAEEKNILDEEFDESSGIIFETYRTSIGAEITNISAVSRIYMYCSTLPKDLFTDLVPYWFFNPETYKCKLRLPSNSGIPFAIEGPKRSTRKESKQAVALEAIKRLHELQLLNDNLLPIRVPKELTDTEYWFPNWDTKDDEKLQKSKAGDGTTFISNIRVPKFLKHCRPLPSSECYLHVIRIKTEYIVPKIQRQFFCHELMQSDEYKFGFLTREPLPEICEFPTYTDLGEVKVTIDVNAVRLNLSKEQLEEVSKFHRSLFLDVLKVVPKCFMYDTDGELNGYFVVPLRLNKETGLSEISWKRVKRRFEADVTKPGREEILRQEYTPENYVAKVVTPWYKPSLCYIVVDVSTELHLNSEFNEKYGTYEEYFRTQYGLIPLRPAQHLLHVRPITSNLDGIIPKPVSVSEKSRRKGQGNETYLPPEYCHVFSFPSVFWYKAIILPSVFHRVYYLLMAEELRQRIAIEARVGCVQLPTSGDDDTFQYFKKLAPSTIPTQKEVNCQSRVKNKLEPVARRIMPKRSNAETKIKDIDRESDVSLEEIKRYIEFTEAPIHAVANPESASLTPKSVVINFVKSPKLMTLNEYPVECGPQAYQILEALTLRGSGDTINLERLETLGDSLLKYLVSISTFIKCAGLNEGHLTQLKGRLVSNQYLFYCGKKLDINSYVKAVRFSAKTSWCPPGFTIPPMLKNQFTCDPLSSLLAASVPYHEQFSGSINEETIEKMLKTDVANYIKNLKEKDQSAEQQINIYLNKQELRRKNISDVMEALLAVYLKTCGIKGAFKVLKYFGVLSNENLEELLNKNPFPHLTCPMHSLHQLLPDYRNIEKLCNYEFKNKAYLLQAFTHPSFTRNDVTGCYQKLEFIGDAVLDFLITSYIFEYCGNLTPGQVTDLRSSLVNNNVFGALAIRLQLQKYLLFHSQCLMDAIYTFVTYQHERNYEIHGNELMTLVNEQDTIVAAEVDVPKALSDIFESLAGAIFLDSGYNLTAVWNLYYSIMKDEIEKFRANIPINPVRALHERVSLIRDGKIVFAEVEPRLGQVEIQKKVSLKITENKRTHEYFGRGDCIKTAKRAASKFALRDLNYNEFVI